jgi:hypothetical protein
MVGYSLVSIMVGHMIIMLQISLCLLQMVRL